MKPLLSICCTTFNHEKFLEKTLEGFLAQQTNFSFEIVIHDDASTDRTVEIIQEYAKKDSRIVSILQTENQYSQNIKIWPNYLFPKAQGKYIALCEGDDYWTDPLKLQKQVDFLEVNPDYVICCHNAKIINENGEHIQDKKLPYLTEDRDYTSFELQQGAFLLTMSLLFRNVG